MTEVEPALDDRLRSVIDEFEREHRRVWEQDPDVSEHWPGVVADVALLAMSKAEKMEAGGPIDRRVDHALVFDLELVASDFEPGRHHPRGRVW